MLEILVDFIIVFIINNELMLLRKNILIILLSLSLFISTGLSLSHHHENPIDSDNCYICDLLITINSYSIDPILKIINAEILIRKIIIRDYSFFQLNIIASNYSLRSPPII
jgi:hypothetical protein